MLKKINLPEILHCYQVDGVWKELSDSRFPIEIVIDGKRVPVIDHETVHRTKSGSFISVAAFKTGEVKVLYTSDNDKSEKLRFYTSVKPTGATVLFCYDHIWVEEINGDVVCGVMSPPRVPFRRVFWERKFNSKSEYYHFGLDADQLADAVAGQGRTVIVKNRDGVLVVAKFNDRQLLNCYIKKGYSNVKTAKAAIQGYNKLQLTPGLNEAIVEVE